MRFRLGYGLLLAGALVGVSAAEVPDAVVADPKHYVVEFENDVIRVLRIKYGPGETSTMHSHEANCVVFLDGGEMTMTLPDGSTNPAPANAPGEVNCGDAVVHLPTNVGDTNTEVILIEMKGRKTVE
jgi:predicted metal-dependent enzyme (double-stranded beta helix superfamily)